MAFSLPDLPYDKSALEPVISARTLEFHHGKHHAGYVKKVNSAISGTALDGKSLEDVIRAARSDDDQGLLNNAAQSWNHAFYWKSLSPESGRPSAALLEALDAAFGGLDSFKSKFKDAGAGHFGSGWVWLAATDDGGLEIRDTHDSGAILPGDDGLTPLLVCDVWEHAYYLDRQNDRGAYLDAVISKRLNWDFASAQYAAATGGETGWTFGSMS